jgi:predicted dehydrogenase
MNTDINDVLIEKPGGLNLENMKRICNTYKDRHILVAYNRRFYSSTKKAIELIESDGGVQSFNMNITELIHKINVDKYEKQILDKWFLSMTTHLIDLAFYLCGKPDKLISFTKKGNIQWHKNSIFTGSGETDKGALFSYHGDWDSAGRWKLEIFTKNHQIIFCPVEKIKIIKKGTLVIEEIDIDITDEEDIKPGILDQVRTFINDPCNSTFINYSEHCTRIEKYYNVMAGYS